MHIDILGECACFLLLVTWEESCDLLDDRFIAGIPLSLAFHAPVSDKLLYCGLKLVHVKRRGGPHALWVQLEVQ